MDCDFLTYSLTIEIPDQSNIYLRCIPNNNYSNIKLGVFIK